MAISNALKKNFQTVGRAAREQCLTLMECTDKATGKPVYVLCAVNADPDGLYSMIPLAKMFDGNPYDEVDPPEV